MNHYTRADDGILSDVNRLERRSTAAILKSSLGTERGDAKYDDAADLNGDGVVNVLDAALLGGAEDSRREVARGSSDGNIAVGPSEQIIIEPATSLALPNGTFEVLFLIRNNVTPLLGYSLDVEVVPGPGARGSVTANISLTNFFEEQNLIAAGCATLDPFFSVIQDAGDGGVFINAITDDNSTCLAVDDVNDVLAQVFFNVGPLACGNFTVQLGAPSALSDGNAFPVPFGFTPGTITISECTPIPTVSEWGVVIMTLLVLSAGTLMIRRLVSIRAV